MIFGNPHPETRQERVARKREWHPFFPLWPRFIKGVGYVWLETIERRCLCQHHRAGSDYWDEYRMPPDFVHQQEP